MPWRLYYVAMTRAKQTLTLMRFPGRHRFQDASLNTSSALFQREPAALTPPARELSRRYQRLSLRDVFLGFGGYRGRSIQCMPPSPRFRPPTRFRRVWRRIVGSCWTRAVRSWDNWRGASRLRPVCAALRNGDGNRGMEPRAFRPRLPGWLALRELGSGGA